MSSLDSRYHTKNRIVAVDIVRVMAAMLVMYEHLGKMGGPITGRLTLYSMILSALSPLFFVLAGFFACRNITWKKSLNNAWWTLAPFVLWNLLTILYLACTSTLPAHYNFFTLFGIQSFFSTEWTLFPEFSGRIFPVNGPLWFMRDLFFLFLLSPILAKWARVVFPVCLFISFFPQVESYPLGQTLSLVSLTSFTAGCMLQTFSKEKQRQALSFYSPVFIIVYTLVMTIDFQYLKLTGSEQFHVIKTLLGLWVYYQVARWIEVRVPWATPFALKFAPVTFLTFAAHEILYRAFSSTCKNIDADFLPSDLTLLLPIACFALMSVFFFALKRWCPGLLHLVAHYKLRPDDMKPEQHGVKKETSLATGSQSS